jgi:hypothetical protein
MIPKLREVLLAQGAHAQKVEDWKGKNIESRFSIDKIQMKGPRSVGGKIAIIGTGHMTFRPAVAKAYDQQNTFSKSMFFKMQIIVLPVTLQTPTGLIVEYYSSQAFDDEKKLQAYLIESNIPLVDEQEVIK